MSTNTSSTGRSHPSDGPRRDDELSARGQRVVRLLDGVPPEELRQTTAQAIDHAYKSAAEVAEMHAQFLGALGTIAELRDENRRLRERIESLQSEQSVRTRSRRMLGRFRARIKQLAR